MKNLSQSTDPTTADDPSCGAPQLNPKLTESRRHWSLSCLAPAHRTRILKQNLMRNQQQDLLTLNRHTLTKPQRNKRSTELTVTANFWRWAKLEWDMIRTDVSWADLKRNSSQQCLIKLSKTRMKGNFAQSEQKLVAKASWILKLNAEQYFTISRTQAEQNLNVTWVSRT